MKLKIIYLGIFIFIFSLFLYADIVYTSSINAVNIWLKNVFPFLFIMFILSDILINLNFDKIFKNAIPLVIILSLLSGAPSNAYIISNLVKQKKLDSLTANYTLLFTYFANPLFMYNIFRQMFSLNITLKLILIHYLSNMLIYLLYFKKVNNKAITNKATINYNLGESIKKSMNNLIMILGTITFYMVVTNIIQAFFKLNSNGTLLIKSLLEVTQGLNYLKDIKLSIKLKQIWASFFISFAGLAIHSQVKTILNEEKLDYKYFLKGRILQGLISLLLTIIT